MKIGDEYILRNYTNESPFKSCVIIQDFSANMVYYRMREGKYYFDTSEPKALFLKRHEPNMPTIWSRIIDKSEYINELEAV